MKPRPNDVMLTILITGDELHELKRFTIDMAEAFGLDRRIEAYSGKRPIAHIRTKRRRRMRRSYDCVTGCRRNTEDSGNERHQWRVFRPLRNHDASDRRGQQRT